MTATVAVQIFTSTPVAQQNQPEIAVTKSTTASLVNRCYAPDHTEDYIGNNCAVGVAYPSGYSIYSPVNRVYTLQPNAWAYQTSSKSNIQSDKTFITWVIKVLHGNGAPKATNLRLATRMSLPAATICSALTAAVYKIR